MPMTGVSMGACSIPNWRSRSYLHSFLPCTRAAEYRVSFITGAQQDRHQRGLPVMAMKNIRYAQHFGSFQHGAAKERESLGVIGIIAGGSPIQRFTIKKLRVVDEVELHSGTF